MRTMTVIYSCFIAASVAIAANDVKAQKQETTTTTTTQTSISDMNGESESGPRRVRTSGRSENPDDGMLAPQEAQSISEMRDSRYDQTYGVRDLDQSTETGATETETETTTETVTQEEPKEEKQGFWSRFRGDKEDEQADVAEEDMSATGSASETTTTTTAAPAAGAAAATATTTDKDAKAKKGHKHHSKKDKAEKEDKKSKDSAKMDADDGKVADQQAATSEADTEITRQIRREVMNNEKLSTRAQNITIVTENGKVALRGSVPSADEKSQIEAAARKVSGVSNVDASQVMVSK